MDTVHKKAVRDKLWKHFHYCFLRTGLKLAEMQHRVGNFVGYKITQATRTMFKASVMPNQ